ncbi:hypothetical protein, partial [Acetobacter tropicalis]|uniref:hypothetical protein n=1 Tax=Acetobacter tropicalis TaxID=104102 RepID=UPI001649E0E5
DYAYDHGFNASQASLAATVAFAESSLGVNTSSPDGSTASGLYQYNEGTWNDRHSNLDRNSESDQITAFYEDLSQLQQQYNNGHDANGNAIPSGVDFSDYVYTKFHYGWNSQNYTGTDVTTYFNGKISELGMSVQ